MKATGVDRLNGIVDVDRTGAEAFDLGASPKVRVLEGRLDQAAVAGVAEAVDQRGGPWDPSILRLRAFHRVRFSPPPLERPLIRERSAAVAHLRGVLAERPFLRLVLPGIDRGGTDEHEALEAVAAFDDAIEVVRAVDVGVAQIGGGATAAEPRREMDEDARALDQFGERGAVVEIAFDHAQFGAARQFVGGAGDRQDVHPMTRAEQSADEVATEEARAAGDRDQVGFLARDDPQRRPPGHDEFAAALAGILDELVVGIAEPDFSAAVRIGDVDVARGELGRGFRGRTGSPCR